MPAAGEIHRLKKQRLPAGFLADDESVKHNGQFNSSLSRLNLIFSRQPNFLATTLNTGLHKSILIWEDKEQQLVFLSYQYLVYLHGDIGISLCNESITEGATYVKP